jgi:hypothetical protein
MTSGEHFNNSPNFGSQEAPLAINAVLGRREQWCEDKGF